MNKMHKIGFLSATLKLFIMSCVIIGSSAISALPVSSVSLTKTLEKTTRTKESIAQRPNPNQDRLLPSGPELPTELPTEPPEPAETSPIEEPTPSADPGESNSQVNISVDRIEVVGNTVLSEADIVKITQPLTGQTVTLSQLNEAADAITQLYLARGYITSRAVLPEQAITDGIVTIQVSEGALGDIQVNGLSRLNERYITSRLQHGVTTPFNANQLEEQLRLLRFDPLVETIQGRLQPGETAGESILTVEAEEADSWRVGLGVDNYGTPSTGSERMSASVAYQNLTGWGDTLSTSYTRSTTGGSNVWDIGYRLPVNSLDGALSLRAAFDNFELTSGRFSGAIDGSSDRYEISFRQPLVRSLRQEFALSAGFTYRNGKNFLGPSSIDIDRVASAPSTDINSVDSAPSTDIDSVDSAPSTDIDSVDSAPSADINRIDSVTSVFKFGQDYTRRDARGVWGLRSQFSFGTGLFDATDNSDDVADGQFFSWLGQVQRIQRLSRDNLLIIQSDLQITPDDLLPVEQFLIGGGRSLRGYRQNARRGDNGFRFSIEDRITLTRDEETENAVIQIAPFLDAGAVWSNSRYTSQNLLAGAGLGFIYDPLESLNMRLDYALPLVVLDDEGDNAQDEGFYFSVNYQY